MPLCRAFFSAPSFAKLPRHTLSQGFYRAIIPGDLFRGFLGIDSLQGLFGGVYFRALTRGGVFPCTLSQPTCPWALPLELFCVRLFAGAISVRSFARAFSLHFFVEALLRNIFRRASSAYSFASLLPWVLSWGRLP